MPSIITMTGRYCIGFDNPKRRFCNPWYLNKVLQYLWRYCKHQWYLNKACHNQLVVLLLEVVLEYNALLPTAVLKEPVVLDDIANSPIPVLSPVASLPAQIYQMQSSIPVVLLAKAFSPKALFHSVVAVRLQPKAVLYGPEVLDCIALYPTAVV